MICNNRLAKVFDKPSKIFFHDDGLTNSLGANEYARKKSNLSKAGYHQNDNESQMRDRDLGKTKISVFIVLNIVMFLQFFAIFFPA